MGMFGFLGAKKSPERIAGGHMTVNGKSANGKSVVGLEPRLSLAGSDAIEMRVHSLRQRLNTHLLATSRDYAVLSSIKSSKIEYCNQVTQEVTRRLAGNPFYEVLQHLDDAQAEIRRPSLGGGR
jgi:hypothetical protein